MGPGELVADVEAEALAHHHVPGRPEPLVQGLLDQLGSLDSRTLTWRTQEGKWGRIYVGQILSYWGQIQSY